MKNDTFPYELSNASGAALAHLDSGLQALRCYVGDPLASANNAIAEAPEMPMAHIFAAWLNLLGTEPSGLAQAKASLATVKLLRANDLEQAHIRAVERLTAGQWHEAGLALEDLSIRWPLDTLALQAGHQIDFFTGNSRMLRDRIARAMAAWSASMPGHHALLGMYAFGLEETADYTRAEQYGRRAVELEPRDGWAWHAVAHVMEMQNRRREGIEWLLQDSQAWSDGSFFAVHNWWHLALFHLGLHEVDEALALVDQRVLGGESAVVLDMIDGSALLWRLQLQGIDVGARWQALADRWTPLANAGNYAFNDMHAMMAFAAAGRDADARCLLDSQKRALEASGDNANFLHDVGLNATRAVQAFAEKRYSESVELLRPIRNRAYRFGGSHAQRDVLDLTLIEAASRDGQQMLAKALREERFARAH